MLILEHIEQKLKRNENVLITLVGDSITWGLTYCSAEETYCAKFAQLVAKQFPETEVLRYDGIPDGENVPILHYNGPFTVQNGDVGRITIVRCGVGGDTVRRVITRSNDFLDKFITGETTDIYTVMLGINDSIECDESKYIAPQGYYQNLNELCDLISLKNPDAKLIFMTPTYNDTGFNTESRFEAYSELMKKVAFERNLNLIDTHKLWGEHYIHGTENHGHREWLTDVEWDACHMTPEGSKATAEFIFEEFKKLTI